MNRQTWDLIKGLIDALVDKQDLLTKMVEDKNKEIYELNNSLDEIHGK